MAYLCKTRGLDPEIVRELIKAGKIYETIQRWNTEKQKYIDSLFHNAVFVAYDKYGAPQNAFLRGTISMTDKPFKKDVDGSDKSYPFTLSGRSDSTIVNCYESAADAISGATICKMQGGDWQDDYFVSLGGTSFLGLERFLSEHPGITTIAASLDKDDTGNLRSKKMMEIYSGKGYKTFRQASEYKDFKEDLMHIGQESGADRDMTSNDDELNWEME
jgi:hypothetical protein